ncbi:protein kinase [Roseibium sp. RKSG952]|uniref:protein kinase domain-containing protein n=1 Tax=Roseibium sp. RKSG952 TaxID=2529384 RepID=UPI0034CFCEDC
MALKKGAGQDCKTGKAVAIKMATQHDFSKLNQIRREIRSLAKLRHPGIIRILDHGVIHGMPWYAMERLSGGTLKTVLRRIWDDRKKPVGEGVAATGTTTTLAGTDTTWPAFNEGGFGTVGPALAQDDFFAGSRDAAAGGLGEVLTLARSMSETLAYVHGMGVVHRDLKPDNVFVPLDGCPVLVDFGLVTEVRGSIGREVMDGTEIFGGSPHYMAPEQIRNETLDARCDLYALGCILYELVTGLKPFSGTRAQVLHGHLERCPVRPSDIVSGVPRQLDELIMSLLAKPLDQRIGYAENVAHVLGDLGAGKPDWAAAVPGAQPYLYRASFVGRSKSRALIEDRLLKAQNGAGQIIVLAGESGAGKTRQASEIASAAAKSGMTVVSCECANGGVGEAQAKPTTQPLYPFLRLLDQVADRCVEGGQTLFDRLLGRHAAALSEYSASIRSLPWMSVQPDLPKLEEEQAKERLFEALRHVLTDYARIRPLLLILDDLQWADGLSIEFVQRLTGTGLDGVPMLVLGTIRSEERMAEIEAIAKSVNVTELSLEKMALHEVEKMAAGMLAVPELPPAFANFLQERSSGNPFFIAEYLRTAVAEQVLQRDQSGRWSFRHPAPDDQSHYETLPVPGTLRDLIDLRLGRLSTAARRSVDCAALIGRRYETGIVSAVEMLGEAQAAEVIDELLERQILEIDDKDGFRFLHDKIREVAEALLPQERRRNLHERIAAALERMSQGADEPGAVSARLGHHWACAEFPGKAARCFRQAASHARRLHAVDEAVQLSRSALAQMEKARETLPEHGQAWVQDIISVNETLGALYTLKRHHELAREALQAALDHDPADPVTKARLYKLQAKALEAEHHHEAALAAYDVAEKVLKSCDLSLDGWQDEYIDIKIGRVWTHYWAANAQDVDQEFAETRSLVENSGAPGHRYKFYLSLIFRNLRRDRYRIDDENIGLGRSLVEAAVELGRETEIATARFELGFLLLFAGKLEEAKQELLKALELTRRTGDTSGEIRTLCYFVILLRRLGDVSQTETEARVLLDAAKEARMMDYVGVAHAALGWVMLRREESVSASAQSRQAVEIWSSLPFDYAMKWTAELTEFKIAVLSGDVGKLKDCSQVLCHPKQLWLPDEIDGALKGVISACEQRNMEETMHWAKAAVSAAEERGYL